MAITGAGGGIGRELALLCAHRGANLALCDINEAGLADTADAIRRAGRDVVTTRVDVSDSDHMNEFAAAARARFNGVDLLVNNAGVGLVGGFLDTSLTDWHWLVSINLMGVVHGCDASAAEGTTSMVNMDITKTNIAVDRALAATENPRHRHLLEAYNRHRYLEMAGRFEEIFEPDMTVANPVYRFDFLGQKLRLEGVDQVQAVYRAWTETDQCVFYAEDEEVAVSDHMVVSRATIYQQTVGAELAQGFPGIDPDAMYLVRTASMMLWPYDDRCRLIGEDVWEYETSAREFIKLAPEDVLTAARAGELLAPLIKSLQPFDDSMLPAALPHRA
ncbi:SDR family NAD(P)-dependent oxidoreductase [Saccharopolyspora shandongensis]|uniref:SDR family NAD(P)-dependent oxidoreductase n=1 Tax=Saccharopolyspora shandongensis TaxID=418495 RepID=UPI00340D61E4